MRTTNFFKATLAIALAVSLTFAGCKKDEEDTSDRLPSRFKVDIPSSLRTSSKSLNKGINEDTLKGNDIYGMLGAFIGIADGSATVVQSIIFSIKYHNINKAMSVSYAGDDGFTKNLVVVENSNFEGVNWQFQLTITDAKSEGNADGGKAIQVFWNDNPIKGIAIIKPYNCDRVKNANYPDPIYRVDYSEAGEYNYDAHMIVSITGLPIVNLFSVNKLKLFAGRKGNYIDLWGNSNHPNAKFLSDTVGFNWAFVASGNSTTNIATAEVGLPLCSINSTDRNVILKDNSVKNVLENEIKTVWPTIGDAQLANYLYNANAPGYFDNKGFICGGNPPTTNPDWAVLYGRTTGLTPYNPTSISNLTIDFK